MLVKLLTSPHAYKKDFHAVHCIIPAHSVASLKNNIFTKHPRVHDELDFATLDRIYEQVMKYANEKMSSFLVMDDATASLTNLEIQILLKKYIFQSSTLPLIDHMPSAVLLCYASSHSKSNLAFGMLQTTKQN